MRLIIKQPFYFIIILSLYLVPIIHSDGRLYGVLKLISLVPNAIADSGPNLAAGKIGYLGLMSIPPNYPSGYQANERCFTGELFTKDPMVELSSDDLLFVPKDYKTIFNSSFLQTLSFSGIDAKMYSSKKESQSDGVQAFIFALPLSFHVENGKKAILEISYKIFLLSDDALLWDNIIKTEFNYSQIPDLLPEKTLIFMIGNHQFNFQPQRFLLAYSAHQNALELVKVLRSKVASTRENKEVAN